MEYSLLCLQIFTLLCIFSLALKGDNETRHNNCFTWRDDKSAVFLTCRVSNFVSPVTFIHEKSQTKVDCNIHDKAHYCTPEGKKITFNQSDSSLTIVLMEKKLGRDLDGKWYCIQGESSKLTQVSLSKGIIIHSWVKIRGSDVFINGSKFIKIDCSSCRRPKNFHAEFILNNETLASLWQIKNGDCRYGHINCTSSYRCSCSQIGNMFSLSIQAQHVNISTNLSCHMQFHDSLRLGTFSTTASHIYAGKDFDVMEFKTDVIKDNTQIIDTGTQMSTKTDSTTYIMPSRRPPNMDSGETIQPEITTAIAVVLTAVFGFVVFSISFYWYRKQKSKNIRQNQETTGIELAPHNESTSLLVQESKPCSYCELVSKNIPAECLCFDCRRLFCLDCNAIVHKISDDLQLHRQINNNLVPESFSLSLLECQKHDAAGYQYFCSNHITVCCRKCLELSHSDCPSVTIDDVSTKQVSESKDKLHLDLQSCADQLAAYRWLLLQGQIVFKAQVASVKGTIELTTNKSFRLDSSKEATPSFLEIVESFDKFENEYNTDITCFFDQISEWRTTLFKTKELLKFLESYAGKNQLTTAVYLFQGQLSEINSNIDSNSNSYYRRTVELDRRHRKIVFRRIELDKLSDTNIELENNTYNISLLPSSSACKNLPKEMNFDVSSVEDDAIGDCQNDLNDGYVNTEYLSQNNVTPSLPIKFVAEPPSNNNGTGSDVIPLTEHGEAIEIHKRKILLEIFTRPSSRLSIFSETSIDF